jgi:hypothetical protein
MRGEKEKKNACLVYPSSGDRRRCHLPWRKCRARRRQYWCWAAASADPAQQRPDRVVQRAFTPSFPCGFRRTTVNKEGGRCALGVQNSFRIVGSVVPTRSKVSASIDCAACLLACASELPSNLCCAPY